MLTERQIADRKIQTRRANIVFMIIGLFVMAGILMIVIGNNQFGSSPRVFGSDGKQISGPAAPTVAPAPKAFDACVMAQLFIKDKLKAPATADFPACSGPDTVVSHTGNDWKVSSHVDSQNSFGAVLRAEYSTAMRYNPATDKWTLTDFSVVNR